jgi:hypothetical protein
MNLKQTFMVVSISLTIILYFGYSAFADQGKEWVPIIGDEPSEDDGEPGLTKLQLSNPYLDIYSVLNLNAFSEYGTGDSRGEKCEEVRDFLLTKEYNLGSVYNRTENSVNPTNYSNGSYGSYESLPNKLLISNGIDQDSQEGLSPPEKKRVLSNLDMLRENLS